MRCPICKKTVCVEGNPWGPFCSERCQLIDLDNWLSERYRIAAPIEVQGESGESTEPDQTSKDDRD